jgi:hypothetical protein
MCLVAFLRECLQQMHRQYEEMLHDLTPEQLHWTANERGVHIAFVAWHATRTEDNVINFVLQRKSTVWLDNGYDQKWGLDRIHPGTGWTLEQARALRLPSAQEFLEYARKVWQATDEFLQGIDESYLEQTVTVRPLGELKIRNAIGNVCITHCFTHLGEIQHLRGLQGLRGALA